MDHVLKNWKNKQKTTLIKENFSLLIYQQKSTTLILLPKVVEKHINSFISLKLSLCLYGCMTVINFSFLTDIISLLLSIIYQSIYTYWYLEPDSIEMATK